MHGEPHTQVKFAFDIPDVHDGSGEKEGETCCNDHQGNEIGSECLQWPEQNSFVPGKIFSPFVNQKKSVVVELGK